MLKFKRLELEDKEIFDKYIYPYRFSSSEYSFSNLYIWRKEMNTEYAIYKSCLIIKKIDIEGKGYFMEPLGYTNENLKDIVDVLIDYKDHHKVKYLFKEIEKDFIEKLKNIYGDRENIFIEKDRDKFDYLYESKKLIDLSGKKLRKKKNHYNYFIKHYDYKVKDFNEKNVIDEVIKSAEKWYDRKEEHKKELLSELDGIKDACRNMDKLNLKGIALYVNDEIIGFTIGETMSEKLAIIHIEKADPEIRGSYNFINRTFIENYFKDVDIINREEDLGIQGLRKAKLSYDPIDLEEKYEVIV